MPAEAPFIAPDVLVLAAGGLLGEAWMNALLAGLAAATGVDFTRTESFVGTSAGAIVAASLSVGEHPAAPPASDADTAFGARARSGSTDADSDSRWAPRRLAGRGLGAAAARLTARLGPAALVAGAPVGALARAALLRGFPTGARSLQRLATDYPDARFDGRLRVCCVDRLSGRRVVFGAPGAPAATVGEAVAASCAIPGVFKPVRIGGRQYVDGAVWSATNLDVATVARDTEVLCLSATPRAIALTPLGMMRAGLAAATALELAALRRIGASVRIVVPDDAVAALIGANLMASGPRPRVARAGHAQGLALGRAGH